MSENAAQIKAYTVEEIQTVLAAHLAWRRGEAAGSRADLYRADLSGAKYGNDELRGFLQVGPIGSRKAILQIFGIGAEGFVFRTGYFTGNMVEFAAQVLREHNNNPHATAYLAAIEFAKVMLPAKPEWIKLPNPLTAEATEVPSEES